MKADTEERVARLEGAYEHLATKADVESLRGEMNGLRGEVRLLASLVTGVQIAAAALIFSRIAGQGHHRDMIFRDVAADVPLPLVLRGLAPGTFALVRRFLASAVKKGALTAATLTACLTFVFTSFPFNRLRFTA